MPAHFSEDILILTDVSNRLGYCKWPLVMISVSRLLLDKKVGSWMKGFLHLYSKTQFSEKE